MPFAIVLTSTMRYFAYSKNADMHYMYGRTTSNGKAALRMYHMQFPDRQMLDHRIFQWLHCQLLETHSFNITRHDAGQGRAIRCPSLEESILNVVDDRPKSSRKASGWYSNVHCSWTS
ncbi:hypothetical protein TNCV_5088561 [Trichonephila clavipes]|nr:hypothetical protein TNCV_5088561 [Trichonephila clavipes]